MVDELIPAVLHDNFSAHAKMDYFIDVLRDIFPFVNIEDQLKILMTCRQTYFEFKQSGYRNLELPGGKDTLILAGSKFHLVPKTIRSLIWEGANNQNIQHIDLSPVILYLPTELSRTLRANRFSLKVMKLRHVSHLEISAPSTCGTIDFPALQELEIQSLRWANYLSQATFTDLKSLTLVANIEVKLNHLQSILAEIILSASLSLETLKFVFPNRLSKSAARFIVAKVFKAFLTRKWPAFKQLIIEGQTDHLIIGMKALLSTFLFTYPYSYLPLFEMTFPSLLFSGMSKTQQWLSFVRFSSLLPYIRKVHSDQISKNLGPHLQATLQELNEIRTSERLYSAIMRQTKLVLSDVHGRLFARLPMLQTLHFVGGILPVMEEIKLLGTALPVRRILNATPFFSLVYGFSLIASRGSWISKRNSTPYCLLSLRN